jgi:hypothetical protein
MISGTKVKPRPTESTRIGRWACATETGNFVGLAVVPSSA